jgi:hypothetical protein
MRDLPIFQLPAAAAKELAVRAAASASAAGPLPAAAADAQPAPASARAGPAREPPAARVAHLTSAPGISRHDDSFARVVLGDSRADVARRGEAYMFWCMDRPSRGAAVWPVSAGDAPFGASAAASGSAADVRMDGTGAAEEGDDGDGEGEGAPVLIAMMAGDAAEWVEAHSDGEVVATVMDALRSLFGDDAVPPPLSHVVTRWRSDPFARGSYSYLPPGSHGVHYDLMAAPVADKLFFAGEATNRTHPTTAAGAFESGVREAVRLGRMFGRARDPDVERILAARSARLQRAALAATGGGGGGKGKAAAPGAAAEPADSPSRGGSAGAAGGVAVAEE